MSHIDRWLDPDQWFAARMREISTPPSASPKGIGALRTLEERQVPLDEQSRAVLNDMVRKGEFLYAPPSAPQTDIEKMLKRLVASARASVELTQEQIDAYQTITDSFHSLEKELEEARIAKSYWRDEQVLANADVSRLTAENAQLRESALTREEVSMITHEHPAHWYHKDCINSCEACKTITAKLRSLSEEAIPAGCNPVKT